MSPTLNLTASILFIEENGSLLEKSRLLRILLNEPPAKVVYEKLLSLQNPDGGFPSRPRAGSPSSLDSTLTAIWQLDELGLFQEAYTRRALDYLVSMQRAYGGWDENPNLPAHDLPPWIRPGETPTRMYLSTYAAYWLGLAGTEYKNALQTAAAFLAAWQEPASGSAKRPERPHTGSLPTFNPARSAEPGRLKTGPLAGSDPAANRPKTGSLARPKERPKTGSLNNANPADIEPLAPGQIPGYLHNNWLATSAFLLAGSGYAQNARLGLDFLLARPLSEFEDSQLAWALDCLTRAKLSPTHPFVLTGLDSLRERRAADGSWASEDGPSFAASATVGVIKVLSRLGAA